MMTFGYTMSCEQAGPKELVTHVQAAEEAGFEFAVISDHYLPWVDATGHSPYAWAVLGAAAHATKDIGLMTFVTCPIKRYHPVIVAQKAATVAVLSDGRFTLGLGAGENLNEHVVGGEWPTARIRHAMLTEAVEIISQLWDGGYVDYRGEYFTADSAKVFDLPEARTAIGIAVSGPKSCALAGRYADTMIGLEPDPKLGQLFEAAGGQGKPRVGQLPVSFGANRDEAVSRAHEVLKWFGGGWEVNAELPGISSLPKDAQLMSRDDVVNAMPCGSDVEEFVEAVRGFSDAGFTQVALVQMGGTEQLQFISWAEQQLLPALRSEFG